MKKLKFLVIQSWILALLFLLACDSNPSNQLVKIKKLTSVSIDSSRVNTLVITKVSKPWYASREMVVGRMRASIPEYQAIKGLKQKFYAFSENYQTLGGIYLWQSNQAAKNWFNQSWFKKVKEKYGKEGVVDFYRIQSVENIALADKNEGGFWAVLSLKMADSSVNKQAEGLLKVVHIYTAKDEKACLSLWQSKALAQKYFTNKRVENTYFDTPILLDNSQLKP